MTQASWAQLTGLQAWWPVALVAARLFGLASVAPALGTPGLGARMRLILAGLLGLSLAPAVLRAGALSAEALPWPGLPAGVTSLLAEVVTGGALGLSAALIVAGARQAGEIVGFQAGLSPAALFDPEAGDWLTPLGHLYGAVAVATFLALDGPWVLVKSVIESYQVVPLGGLPLTEHLAAWAFARVGDALSLAIRAAAPPALAIALAGFAVGLLGRAAPSLQLVALALPVRFLVGLLTVGLGVATLAATFSNAWQDWAVAGLTE
ncbi:flagellar biosynthetic protein FliR [Isosphaeraceae bacterium EP7]